MIEPRERLYKMKEACTILGVHPNTIRLWDKQGKIRVVRPRGGQRRIPESEINRLLHKTPALAPPSRPTLGREEELSFFLNYVFSHYRDDWELVKKAVIIRDNYTCQECGGRELIGVHHKDETSRNDPDNLITLCQKCHDLIHGRSPSAPEVQAHEPKIPLEVPPSAPEKPTVWGKTELPRHVILDELAPAGLVQRTIFGGLLSAAAVLGTFTPEELASRARCPEATTKTFCERMSARGYLVGKDGTFEMRVRLAR